jgi:hypothetical protein
LPANPHDIPKQGNSVFGCLYVYRGRWAGDDDQVGYGHGNAYGPCLTAANIDHDQIGV